jgi:hypothetical protein
MPRQRAGGGEVSLILQPVTYSILNSERVEIDGTRTDSLREAMANWQALHGVMICFLVRWECPGLFTVLEPS